MGLVSCTAFPQVKSIPSILLLLNSHSASWVILFPSISHRFLHLHTRCEQQDDHPSNRIMVLPCPGCFQLAPFIHCHQFGIVFQIDSFIPFSKRTRDRFSSGTLGKSAGFNGLLNGSDKFYPEEKPVHKVTVDTFWIEKCPVTNKAFSDFVSATNYLTVAERPLNPPDFPSVPEENLVPGSMVFEKRNEAVDLKNYANWWQWMKGASWKHPQGQAAPLLDWMIIL